MTFCSLLLVPDTSKVTVSAVLLYVMSTLLTWMDESVSQFVNPEVDKTSAAKTPRVVATAAMAAAHIFVLAMTEDCAVRLLVNMSGDSRLGRPFES